MVPAWCPQAGRFDAVCLSRHKRALLLQSHRQGLLLRGSQTAVQRSDPCQCQGVQRLSAARTSAPACFFWPEAVQPPCGKPGWPAPARGSCPLLAGRVGSSCWPRLSSRAAGEAGGSHGSHVEEGQGWGSPTRCFRCARCSPWARGLPRSPARDGTPSLRWSWRWGEAAGPVRHRSQRDPGRSLTLPGWPCSSQPLPRPHRLAGSRAHRLRPSSTSSQRGPAGEGRRCWAQ